MKKLTIIFFLCISCEMYCQLVVIQPFPPQSNNVVYTTLPEWEENIQIAIDNLKDMVEGLGYECVIKSMKQPFTQRELENVYCILRPHFELTENVIEYENRTRSKLGIKGWGILFAHKVNLTLSTNYYVEFINPQDQALIERVATDPKSTVFNFTTDFDNEHASQEMLIIDRHPQCEESLSDFFFDLYDQVENGLTEEMLQKTFTNSQSYLRKL